MRCPALAAGSKLTSKMPAHTAGIPIADFLRRRCGPIKLRGKGGKGEGGKERQKDLLNFWKIARIFLYLLVSFSFFLLHFSK